MPRYMQMLVCMCIVPSKILRHTPVGLMIRLPMAELASRLPELKASRS